MSGARWPTSQVEGLSPDAASLVAARKLALGGGWSECGCTDRAVWGLAQGSGKQPYRAVVDLAGPAYSCSCPSRKFPCKHALALLLRWSGWVDVPDGAELPEYAATWLAGRTERAERAEARAEAKAETAGEPAGGLADPEAAARRRDQRAERVAGGLVELERWLADQVRGGLAGVPAKGYAAFEPVAARMTDAQAPGIASWLRALPAVVASGERWPERLLEELALLHLLVRAHARLPELDELDPGLAATVRQAVGYPVAKEAVLAEPAVLDTWSVVGLRDSELGTLAQRTVWLTGRDTGRDAVVLSFAAPGQSLDATLVPGTAIVGGLHFYPGARPRRALVGEHAAPVPHLDPPPVCRVAAALDRVAEALAADPWARDVAVWVDAVPARAAYQGGWVVVDELGEALPLRAGPDPWRLVATCGGLRHPVLLDWSPTGWLPLSVLTGDGLVTL